MITFDVYVVRVKIKPEVWLDCIFWSLKLDIKMYPHEYYSKPYIHPPVTTQKTLLHLNSPVARQPPALGEEMIEQ